MAPYNDAIVSRYSFHAFSAKPTSAPDSDSARLARQALLGEPSAADALTVLGFQAQLRGETARADRIFNYSLLLSRRELRPRLWEIEEDVARGDIAGAVRNYDIALRTSKQARIMLYPTLTAALRHPQVRREVLGVLAQRPVWEDTFLDFAASSGIEAVGVMQLFVEGRRFGLATRHAQRVSLVNVLYNQGKQGQAWTYYRILNPSTPTDRSRDPRFALAEEPRPVFEWRAGDDTRVSASILSGRDGAGILDYSAAANSSGVFATQAQALPAGSYRLEGRSANVRQTARDAPYWTVICVDGRELGRVFVQEGRFEGAISVPPGCPTQMLQMVARPSDTITGVSGQIEELQLAPTR
jgi:hypothetical protein